MITFKRLEVRNFGVLSEASLALDRQGLVLIRGDNQDTTAASSNGAGKTTMFKALSWCLFGEVVGDGRVTDEVIRKGTKKALVTVEFDDGTHDYKVERHRTPSGGKLTLYTDGVSTTGRTAKDTEARICELLGLDWHAFRNTVLYGQGDIKRFADKHTSDGERKGILKQVLRLDVYDKAKEEAKRRLKALQADLLAEVGVQTTLKVRQEEAMLSLDGATARRDVWDLEARREAREWREEAADLREQATTQQEDADKAERHREAIAELEERLEELRGADERLNLASEARVRIMEAHAALKGESTALNSKAQTAEYRWTTHMSEARRCEGEVERERHADDCPTCGQPWSEEIRAERLEEVEKALAEATRLAKEATAATVEASRLADEAAQAVIVHALEVTHADVAHHDAQADAAALAEARTERDRLWQELSTLEEAEEKQERLLATALDLDSRATEREQGDNPHQQTVDESSAKLARINGQLEAQEVVLEKLRQQEPPLKWWVEAFSDKGLPSLAMDNVMPVLTESANTYLDILTDGDIAVDISTEKSLKGGGTRDSISITQSIEGLSDVTPSGGQRSKISLAVDLGLMDVVASREGAEINLMMLDEVLDGLDGEGKARVVDLLQHLRTIRPSLFVVSHDDSIQEHFEKVITVSKRGGKSTLEEQ